mmetsp:Transcript_85513/g.151323  ORF Transcript_85513/g.151323 Transcript_85513/m.151323 type:complete len:238 (-) Transcript_85513:1181-1894(-)
MKSLLPLKRTTTRVTDTLPSTDSLAKTHLQPPTISATSSTEMLLRLCPSFNPGLLTCTLQTPLVSLVSLSQKVILSCPSCHKCYVMISWSPFSHSLSFKMETQTRTAPVPFRKLALLVLTAGPMKKRASVAYCQRAGSSMLSCTQASFMSWRKKSAIKTFCCKISCPLGTNAIWQDLTLHMSCKSSGCAHGTIRVQDNSPLWRRLICSKPCSEWSLMWVSTMLCCSAGAQKPGPRHM